MSKEVDDFLMHYGVRGMKWGKRKREESGDDQAKAEAKAIVNKQKAEKFHTKAAENKKLMDEMDSLGIQSPEMRRLYGKAVDQSDRMFRFTQGISKERAIAERRSEAQKKYDIAVKDAAAKEQGKLSRGQKIAIGGAAVGAGLLIAYGAYKYPDIVTRNAQAGDNISVNNFMKRYTKRSEEFSKPLSKDAFNKLDDNDIVVSAGTKFKRVTQNPNEELTDRMYAAYKQGDADRYQGIYSPVLKQRTRAKNLYVTEMEMGASIKSPSHKKRVEILLEMARENKTFIDKEGQKISLKDQLDFMEMSNMKMSDLLSGKTSNSSNKPLEDRARENYNLFARGIVMDNPISKEYFSKVKEKGYNALIDDNDRGQLADAPMILLDAANTVRNRVSKPLTDKVAKEARKRITEIIA